MRVELSRKLHTSHFEELDFLLAQRLSLFHDPEITWPEIAEFEERLMAHLDGLILGGESADAMARELLVDGDADVVRGAVFALGNSKCPGAIESLRQSLDETSSELAPSYVRGLKYSANSLLAKHLTPLLDSDKAHVRAAAIEILGYRREGAASQIARALEDSDAQVACASAISLRKLRASEAIPQLILALGHIDHSVAAEASFSLAALGDQRGVQRLRELCATGADSSAPIYLGMCGSVSDAETLQNSTLGSTVSGLEALGIFGSAASLHFLSAALESESDEIRLSAAGSLNLITGANLTEEITRTEEWIDTDGELLETDEIQLTRAVCSKDIWSKWLDDHKELLSAGGRLRFGRECNRTVLVEEISNEKSTFERRQNAYLELAGRYDLAEAFEPDWFISKQKEAIARW